MIYYRRLYPILWTNERFTSLTPGGKLLALHVLTGQANRIGLFSFSLALAGEQTGLAPDPWHVVAHGGGHVGGIKSKSKSKKQQLIPPPQPPPAPQGRIAFDSGSPRRRSGSNHHRPASLMEDRGAMAELWRT